MTPGPGKMHWPQVLGYVRRVPLSHNFNLATWNSSGVHTLDATVPLACNAFRGNRNYAVKVEPSSAGSSSAFLRTLPVTRRASRSMAYEAETAGRPGPVSARSSDDEIKAGECGKLVVEWQTRKLWW
ncbi:hypothetical protein MY11210_001738 [Beauveria gryllotalpidicola]